MSANQKYYYVAVETFFPFRYEPSPEFIRVRPLPGQDLPIETRVECGRDMLRQCFPVGTVFLLKAKISQREHGSKFVYSYFDWPYVVVSREDAERLISEKQVGIFETARFNGFLKMKGLEHKTYKRVKEIKD